VVKGVRPQMSANKASKSRGRPETERIHGLEGDSGASVLTTACDCEKRDVYISDKRRPSCLRDHLIRVAGAGSDLQDMLTPL
jgi:hypothetical protein